MMKIISWNVNSLRACCDKGLISFIKKTKAEIYALQEIKCLEEQVPEEFSQLKNYHKYYFPAVRKGYSGVATICKQKPNNSLTDVFPADPVIAILFAPKDFL